MSYESQTVIETTYSRIDTIDALQDLTTRPTPPRDNAYYNHIANLVAHLKRLDNHS